MDNDNDKDKDKDLYIPYFVGSFQDYKERAMESWMKRCRCGSKCRILSKLDTNPETWIAQCKNKDCEEQFIVEQQPETKIRKKSNNRKNAKNEIRKYYQRNKDK